MIRLAVRVAAEHADVVLADLLVLAPSGLEEVELEDGRIEFAIYGAPGELPELPDLEAAAGEARVEVESRELADDWADRWREFHRPVEVAGRLRIRPPWTPQAEDDLIDLVIDPGQAFGTGAHPTTRLCLELLCGIRAGGSALDVGCGSGVLAIAAAKLGFDPVRAVDHDRLSVAATESNATANEVRIDAARFDLRGTAPLPAADCVLANLLAPLVRLLADRVVATPSTLIVSGLLNEQVDAALTQFRASHALDERKRLTDGEWSAVLLERAD